IQPNPTYNLLIDPLQPLRDDLDSGIYDQFEKDITKYDQYEAAMDLAIDDLIGQYMLDPLVVLVVGPGNGGILDRLLKIVEAHPLCNFKVYAVEKNPKCYRILKTYNSIKWNNKVTIIMDDIRFVSLSFHPHLIVSELLGSFGDNELCPEILARFNTNTVQKPCLMIPNSYTTYLQPIYSNIDIPGYDQPYIVNLTRYYPICEFQEVWTWEHPSSIINTTFSTKLNFDIYNNEDCEVTGFYGYFKANLYGHINIQIIDPMDTTTYCKSWYPILFPVRRSKVQKISKFELSISRLSDDHKAWYEWEFMGVHYNKDRCSYIDAS
ncbi:methyltransferase family protein, partial [Scheffersomyces amazonensis]|uniref:methyltransferase family protein n=1 Tax=Scheffersomyces amazonensis TaxID=1078765 RepID=UPI00315D2C49